MLLSAVVLGFLALASASSHSESRGNAEDSRADLSDYYLFRSPEHDDYITTVVNLDPLRQSQSGPNYGPTPQDRVIGLHYDNDGDAHPDVTVQFYFGSKSQEKKFPVPQGGSSGIPLVAFGQYADGAAEKDFLNNEEYYQARVMWGEDYATNLDVGPFLTDASGNKKFTRAFEFSGEKTFPANAPFATSAEAYDDYVNKNAVYKSVKFPRCAHPAKVFVGPRRDSFSIALGKTFDLINFNPVSPADDENLNSMDRQSVISIVLEVHKDCLNQGRPGTIVGGWSTVRKLEHKGINNEMHFAGDQVSRLANPLVNELIIGIPDKERYSESSPADDRQFLSYFRAPALPAIIKLLFNVEVPSFSREDLVNTFLRGYAGFNRPAGSKRKRNVGGTPQHPRVEVEEHNGKDTTSSSDSDTHHHRGGVQKHHHNHNDGDNSHSHDRHKVKYGRFKKTYPTEIPAPQQGPQIVYADILRLDYSKARTASNAQSNKGVLGGNFDGFPNGRRLGDDVVDIALGAMMGNLCRSGVIGTTVGACTEAQAPFANTAFGDGSPINGCFFSDSFPYLNRPVPGNVAFSDAWPKQFRNACP